MRAGAQGSGVMTTLPSPGHWALGPDAQAVAEALVQEAQRAGLRTGWLAGEAGFLSNLNIEENLRLLHDWGLGDGDDFDTALARAAAQLAIDVGAWLPERPSQLRASELLRARLLRLLLLRPDLVVLQPSQLTQAGPLAAPFIAGLAGARLLLLADPAPDWPAWPPSAVPAPAGFAALEAAAASAPAVSAGVGTAGTVGIAGATGTVAVSAVVVAAATDAATVATAVDADATGAMVTAVAAAAGEPAVSVTGAVDSDSAASGSAEDSAP